MRKGIMMKKKWLYAAVALIVIAAAVLIGTLVQNNAHKGDKEITVTVVDQTKDSEEEVFNKKLYTDAEDLTSFLKEQTELKAEIEDSTYGSLLTSICSLDQDMEKGPYLVFESDNNQTCKAYGMCPAMDVVVLEDGDSFTFKLIAGF